MKKNKYIKLPRKINKLDFSISPSVFFKISILALMLNNIAAYLLQANIIVMVITSVIVMLMVPFFVYDKYLYQYHSQRFFDLSQYMENIIIAFTRHNAKIVVSLEDVRNLFPADNHIHHCLDNVLYYINNGQHKNELYAEAFQYIEKDYDNPKVRLIHQWIINVIYDGGDFQSTSQILLNDKKAWYDATQNLINKKKSYFNVTCISVLLCVAMCAYLDYVISYKVTLSADMRISDFPAYQIVTCIFLLMIQWTLKKSYHNATMDWIAKDTIGHAQMSKKDLLQRYDFIKNFSTNPWSYYRKDLITASPWLIASVVFYLIFYKWQISLVLLVISLFFLFKDRIAFNIENKKIHSELYYALSQWYLQLALLLKNNNSQVAIEKSIKDAPPLLTDELQLMIDRINENPNDITSYTKFMEYFHDPSIISAMQILSSMANAGNDQAAYQLAQLLDSAFLMQQEADKTTNDNLMINMKNLYNLPDMFIALKLVIDALLMMMLCFQTYLNF